MTRRKTFDSASVPLAFWRRDDVRLALVRREIGTLFTIFLATFPDCTQTQLALLTGHDRSDVSNFVRGTRNSRVADIDVLGRIADGLATPDEARVMLGLAPVEVPMSAMGTGRTSEDTPAPSQDAVTTGWFRPTAGHHPLRVSICGSRSAGVDNDAIDEAIIALSRLFMNRHCEVDHGPLGVGIELMTYIADHYRPPTLRAAVGLFGRPNVVRNADYVLVIGGGRGTMDEVELAHSMGKKVLPFAASGGAARAAMDRTRTNVGLRRWSDEDTVTALGTCANADEFARLVEQIISTDSGEHHT